MITRRKFLKTSLLTSATLLTNKNLSYGITSKKTSSSDPEYADCIIIGAGLAGLTAARDLSLPKDNSKPYKTIILEASHQVGGRIFTIDDTKRFGGPLEMGAEYIHRGPLSGVSIWEDIRYYKQEILTFPRMQKGLVYYDGYEDELIPQFKLPLRDKQRPDKLLTFSNKIELYQGKNISAKDWMNTQNFSNFEENIVNLFFTGHMPAPIDRLSLKGFVSDRIPQQLRGFNEYGFPKGFGNFVKQFTQGVEQNSNNKLDIKYGEIVVQIKYNQQFDFGMGVEITTSSGKVYRAKSAIVTTSVGILKKKNIEFFPPLPESKDQALSWIEMGDRAKVIIKFSQRFWPKDAVFINRVDNHNPLARTYFVPFAHSPEKNKVLTVYFSGPEADQIRNKNLNDILLNLAKDFNTMFPKEAANAGGTLYNLIEGAQDNKPTLLKWQWSDAPNALGGVSYLKSGEEAKGQIPVTEARKALASPLDTPTLFWAGEATAFGKGTQPSCTHGAHHSGKRAANEVRSFLRSKA